MPDLPWWLWFAFGVAGLTLIVGVYLYFLLYLLEPLAEGVALVFGEQVAAVFFQVFAFPYQTMDPLIEEAQWRWNQVVDWWNGSQHNR